MKIFFLCVITLSFKLKLAASLDENIVSPYINSQKNGEAKYAVDHLTKTVNYKHVKNEGTEFKGARKIDNQDAGVGQKIEKENQFTELNEEYRDGIRRKCIAYAVGMQKEKEEKAVVGMRNYEEKQQIDKRQSESKEKLEIGSLNTYFMVKKKKGKQIHFRNYLNIVEQKTMAIPIEIQNKVKINYVDLGDQSTDTERKQDIDNLENVSKYAKDTGILKNSNSNDFDDSNRIKNFTSTKGKRNQVNVNITYLDIENLGTDLQDKKDMKNPNVEDTFRAKRGVNEDDVIDTCKATQSCEYNDKLDLPNCYCDNQCRYFNDCCYMYNESMALQEMPNMSAYEPYLECRIDVIPGRMKRTKGYLMVTKCPSTYIKDEQVSRQCNGTTNEDIPVTDENGIVYGNAYCAECHGKTEYIPWMVNIKAVDMSCHTFLLRNDTVYYQEILARNELEEFRQHSCNVIYKPSTERRPRVCYPGLLVSEEKRDNALCKKYRNPVFIDFIHQYRNIYCVEDWEWSICAIDGFPYQERAFRYPLSILFTLRQNSKIPCEPDNRQDSQTAYCFPKGCSRGDSTPCVEKSEILFQNYHIAFTVQLTSNGVIDPNMASRALFVFWWSLPVETYQLQHYNNKAVLHTSDLPIYPNGSETHSVVNASFNALIKSTLRSDQITDLKTSIDNMDFTYVENKIENSESELKMLVRKWNLITIDRANVTSTYLKTIGTISTFDVNQFSNTSEALNLPKSCNARTEYNASAQPLTVLAFIDCKYDTDKIISNDDENQSDIVPKNDTFYVSDSNSQFIQAYLTYITLGVSSVAIVPSLVIHRYLNLTSMTSGHISENALIILLLFNLMFMFGIGKTNDSIFCLFSAVTTHYFILSLFTWISIFVVHTMKMISRLQQPKTLNALRKIKFPKSYYAIGYITPLVIVVPSLVVHMFTGFNISYTEPICFLTGYPANLVIFICPVLLSLLFNLACLFYSACCLFKLSLSINNVGIRNSRSYVSLYMRLCVVSGLSWALGVLSEILDNDVLRYIFIVLSGSHGLLFCISIFSSRTFRERLHEKFSELFPEEEIEMNEL